MAGVVVASWVVVTVEEALTAGVAAVTVEMGEARAA